MRRKEELYMRRNEEKEELYTRRNEEGRKISILEGMKKEGRAVY